MHHGGRVAVAALVTLVAALVAAQTAAGAIFLGSGSGISRIDVDGTDRVHQLIDRAARGVVATDTHVYWADATGSIGRARLDGSDVQPAFVDPGSGSSPTFLAVDDTYLYWTDWENEVIRRASLATGAIDVGWLPSGVQRPTGIAVDATYVYWASRGTGHLVRAPLANPAAWSYVYPVSVGAELGLALFDGQLYVGTLDDVRRVTIAPPANTPFASSVSVKGVAADADHVYWLSGAGPTLVRADRADPATRQETDVAGLSLPYGVALGPRLARISLSAAPAFPDAVEGQVSSAQAVTVTNTGEAPLTFGSRAITGADADQFEITATTCGATLAVNASCAVSVRFAPTTAGAKAAALTVTAPGAETESVSVGLSGTALGAPAMAFGPAPVFPDALVGEVGPDRAVTLSNGGGSPLTVSDVSLAGADAADFALVSETCTAGPVPVSGSCEAVVRFAPGSPGAKTAALRVLSDAPSSPDELAIVATAIAAPPPAAGALAPVASALTPSHGAPGSVVTIKGAWLGTATRVLFGERDATGVAPLAFDRLTAVVPDGPAGATVEVRVLGPGGASGPLPFTFDPAPAPIEPPPLAPPAARSCTVPDLAGATRKQARRRLRQAGCRLGRVRRTADAPRRRAVVVKQSRRAGRVLAAGARVHVRLGRA